MNILLNWFGIATFRGNVVVSSFDLFAMKREFVFALRSCFLLSALITNINSNLLMDNAYKECFKY